VSADPARTVATWLWQATADIREIVAFVTARRLREVYVAVPLTGVDDHVASLTAALRAKGIAVSCLGGDPMWTVDHDTALNWAFRAMADAVFDGVHLDVEPWALPRWPSDAAHLMGSYATLVEEMTEVAPLAVDLVPWLMTDHREVVSHVVRQCGSIGVLAYRDRAAAILSEAGGLLSLCQAAGIRYRIGVETQSPTSAVPANTTFGDDGEAVMLRELGAVAAQIRQPLFDGFAVHHLASWRAMLP
jgi:hypothetical protein